MKFPSFEDYGVQSAVGSTEEVSTLKIHFDTCANAMLFAEKLCEENPDGPDIDLQVTWESE